MLRLDGWGGLMDAYADGASVAGARLYFVAVIFVGNFFVINVALAVVTNCYATTRSDLMGT